MASNQDIETGENYEHEEITSPLLSKEKRGANGDDEDQSKTKTSKEDRSMVYFSTFVAVCGSYAFGSGVSKKNLLFLVLIFTVILRISKLIARCLILLSGRILVTCTVVHHTRPGLITTRGWFFSARDI